MVRRGQARSGMVRIRSGDVKKRSGEVKQGQRRSGNGASDANDANGANNVNDANDANDLQINALLHCVQYSTISANYEVK